MRRLWVAARRRPAAAAAVLALLGAGGGLGARPWALLGGWRLECHTAAAAATRGLAGQRTARRGRRRPGSALRVGYEDGEFGGSILDQLEALDAEDPTAQSVIDDEWSSEFQKQVQQLKDSHQQAVDDGRLMGHAPVLLYSAMEFLFRPEKKQANRLYSGTYVDCTFGRGGHTREILARLGDDARLIAFDIDPDAVEIGRALAREDSRFQIIHRPFAEIAEALEGVEIDGALMDIGVSNPMVDEWGRGFSLQNLDGVERPVDLRMNPDAGISAMEWLQTVSTEELAHVLAEYGPNGAESVVAERVAQAIVDEQERNGPYTSMRRLAETVVKGCQRNWADEEDDFEHPVMGADHPAKLWIQGIRVYLNQELEQLEAGLTSVFRLLAPGARCVVAVFKRSESNRIKSFLLKHEDPDPETVSRISTRRRLVELYPLVGTDNDYAAKLVGGKPMKPSYFEINKNRRARSSSLWVLEKIPRLTKQFKARPRLLRNRFREVPPPTLIQEPDSGTGDGRGKG